MTAPLPQVVVVAGGKGTRLGALAADVPKILVPVAGRPFLDYVLDLLRGEGATRIHFCLGHHADQVLAYLAARPFDGLEFSTSVETRPLGTGGAVRAALPWLAEEFGLLLGDTYTPVDFADLVARFRSDGRQAAMSVLHNKDWLVPSNVAVAAGSVIEYTKSAAPGRLEHVDYGISVVRRDAVLRLPAGESSDLRQLFESLIADGQLAALEVSTRFYEIGSPHSYAEFARLVTAGYFHTSGCRA